MRKTATITTKGQLTMPVEVRRYLGVKEGDQVEFVSEDGRLFVRPLRGDNPFVAFAGTRP